MNTKSLQHELGEIVGQAHVLTHDVDKLAYNNDCWPRGVILARGRQLKRHMPLAIVRPANEAEIQKVIAWARKNDQPIVPFGAGSGVCGGTVVEQGQGIVLDVKRLKSILKTDADNMTMRAQAGIIGMNMERELQRRGLTLGHYPSSLICSSLGGYLAGRSAGQYSSRYGKIEDMVDSVKVITGTSSIVETASDITADVPMVQAHAHDLTQLMVGSEGTLGVITEATLRLHPHPKKRHYAGFHFDGVEQALDAVRVLMQQGLRPAVVRLYDEFDTFIASRGKKDKNAPSPLPEKLLSQVSSWIEDVVPIESSNAVKHQVKDTVNAITKGVLGRVLGQPILLNKMIDAMPYACLLIVGFEGDGQGVTHEANYAFDYLGRYGQSLGPEAGEHWYENRFSVSYKQSAMYAAGAFIDTMEVSTTWDNLSNLYWSVRKALAPHVMVMAHFSHVYPEGSSIYFTFAGYGHDLDDTLRRYEDTWATGLAAVAKAGASTAHHHGVGQSKAMWSAHDHRGGQALFDGLKAVFDPDGIMNPGKVYRPGGLHE